MLTAKAKYGLKALLHLAVQSEGEPVLIGDIAGAQNIPKKFLEAILLELRNQGLLVSRKGKGGGYLLARPAAQIMIGNVLRILDGPSPGAHQGGGGGCHDCGDDGTCVICQLMGEVREAIGGVLNETSLRDLADRGGTGEPILMYYI